jgi:hypothetical protein
MNYAILIYDNEAQFAARSDPEPKKRAAYVAAWAAYTNALKDAGVFVGGAGLQAPPTATTLRFPDSQRQVQDGPFADTKEQLAGFYLIQAAHLDEALEWAARFPRAEGRVLEVRPCLTPLPA